MKNIIMIFIAIMFLTSCTKETTTSPIKKNAIETTVSERVANYGIALSFEERYDTLYQGEIIHFKLRMTNIGTTVMHANVTCKAGVKYPDWLKPYGPISNHIILQVGESHILQYEIEADLDPGDYTGQLMIYYNNGLLENAEVNLRVNQHNLFGNE